VSEKVIDVLEVIKIYPDSAEIRKKQLANRG